MKSRCSVWQTQETSSGASAPAETPGNVVAAVEAARAHNILTVGFTGKRGGKLRDLVNVWVPTPSDDVIQVENLHLILAHAIAVSVEAIVSPMQK